MSATGHHTSGAVDACDIQFVDKVEPLIGLFRLGRAATGPLPGLPIPITFAFTLSLTLTLTLTPMTFLSSATVGTTTLVVGIEQFSGSCVGYGRVGIPTGPANGLTRPC